MGFTLPMELAGARRDGNISSLTEDPRFEEWYGVSREHVGRMLPFEMLEPDKADGEND